MKLKEELKTIKSNQYLELISHGIPVIKGLIKKDDYRLKQYLDYNVYTKYSFKHMGEEVISLSIDRRLRSWQR